MFCVLCLTSIGFVQCFSFGSGKVSYTLLLRFSQNFVLRVLPHKHRVCAVPLPRLCKVCCMLVFNFALFSHFLLCVFCLRNIMFVQCSPFGSCSLLHAFVVSNLCFVLFASPTSGLCSAFPFGSPQVYTLLFFFVLFSLLLLCVLCPTSSGLCSDFSPAPLEFACLIFCFVLFSFNFVFCILSLTNLIFLRFP